MSALAEEAEAPSAVLVSFGNEALELALLVLGFSLSSERYLSKRFDVLSSLVCRPTITLTLLLCPSPARNGRPYSNGRPGGIRYRRVAPVEQPTHRKPAMVHMVVIWR